MDPAKEYRAYAKECLEWATEADTDEQRQSFLDMARDWTLAALKLENRVIPEATLNQSDKHDGRDTALPEMHATDAANRLIPAENDLPALEEFRCDECNEEITIEVE